MLIALPLYKVTELFFMQDNKILILTVLMLYDMKEIYDTLGHLQIAQILVQHGASVNVKSNTGDSPLHCASSFGASDVVLFLIQQGASVNKINSSGNTSLHAACNRGFEEVVKILLSHGANPNKQGQYQRTPLHCAALRKNTNLMTLLLQNNADIDLEELGIFVTNMPMLFTAYIRR